MTTEDIYKLTVVANEEKIGQIKAAIEKEDTVLRGASRA